MSGPCKGRKGGTPGLTKADQHTRQQHSSHAWSPRANRRHARYYNLCNFEPRQQHAHKQCHQKMQQQPEEVAAHRCGAGGP